MDKKQKKVKKVMKEFKNKKLNIGKSKKKVKNKKLQKYMTDLDSFMRRPSLTDEDRIILATAMLYTTRIVYEENYGADIAINLIDTLGGSKVQYQKPTVH